MNKTITIHCKSYNSQYSETPYYDNKEEESDEQDFNMLIPQARLRLYQPASIATNNITRSPVAVFQALQISHTCSSETRASGGAGCASSLRMQNIKSDLRETFDALHALCTMATVTKDVIHSVLGDILTTNEIFRNKQAAHVILWRWFQESVPVFNKEHRRILSICETILSNSSLPPPLQHHFSFSPREQGGIVEEFLNFAERDLFQFFVQNANCVMTTEVASFGDKSRPKIESDFANANTLSMLNFLIAYKDNYKTTFQEENKEDAIEILTNYKKNCSPRHRRSLE
ncbi:hypothetical protein BC938DRAFT_477115 [Jimgerdemannia flammicorona]|uniref:Uncharacterized protein n=1 Tax=Jimgerdemannia flammicorona TaxID=994334 RepID=A0A433PBW8_9FUNG|nr:hypothetical protein BC938DRAFT_477115 [Jimgerdemannia flammicorona]